MNRYNYNSSRKRSYASRNGNTGNSVATSIVTLTFLVIVMAIWILSLKSDIRSLKSEKEALVKENVELNHKTDSIAKSSVPPKIPCALKPEPKKIFKRHSKDTTKTKLETIETKPATTPIPDTTKI
jgi:hypothetical protein